MLRRRGPKPDRLDPKIDRWVRDAVHYAKGLVAATYDEIDGAVGAGPRWSRNALSRPKLAKGSAKILMDWVEMVVRKKGDPKSLSSVKFVKATLIEHPTPPPAVPFLVLSRDVDRVSEAFDDYLRERRHSGKRGLLKDFLTRHVRAGDQLSFGRSCGLEFADSVGRRMRARRNHKITIYGAGPPLELDYERVQTILRAVEGLVNPKALPAATRADLNKARRRATH